MIINKVEIKIIQSSKKKKSFLGKPWVSHGIEYAIDH